MNSRPKKATEADDAADADACVEIEVDAEAHLVAFTKLQQNWASNHSLDLRGEVGLMLAAILAWPPQYQLPVGTESGFCRAHMACTILHNEGLFASDVADGKTEAIRVFDADFQLHLKTAGLKPPELSRIIGGLEVLASVGEGSKKRKSATCPGDSLGSKPTTTRRRASNVVVGKLQQEFGDDFTNGAVFNKIQVCC